MPENDPRQIDVGLNIVGDETLKTFIDEIKKLREAMAASTGVGAPSPVNPQSGAGGASRPPTPTSSGPSSGGEWNRFTRPDIEAQELGEQPTPSRSPGGPSRPGGGGGGAFSGISKQGWQGQVPEEATLDPIAMPRFGEFTFQDTMNMMANLTGSAAYRGPDKLFGASRPGLDPQGNPIDPSNVSGARNFLGQASGAFQLAQNYSPYLSRAQQALGMPFSPQALQAQGMQFGLQRTQGADVNLPFGLGGFQVPGSQYFGQAGSSMLQQNIRSVGQGMQPGISITEAKDMAGALNSMGWTDQGDVGPMTDIYSYLKNQGTTMPSASVTASIMDQSMRYGNTSQNDLQSTFLGMDKAAQGARMSLDEFAQGLDQAGNYLQSKGLTYNQGVNAAKNFSSITDMPPETMQTIMDNPLFQGAAMGRYGILPEAQGALATPENSQAFMGTTLSTIKNLTRAYSGAFQTARVPVTDPRTGAVVGMNKISPTTQARGMVAEQLGMTPDQLGEFMKRQRVYTQQSAIESAARGYGRSIGQFGPGGVPAKDANSTTWVELQRIMQEHGSHFGQDFIGSLQGMRPDQRVKAIESKIRDLKPQLTGQNPNKPMIDLTPRAARILREVMNPQQHSANTGDTTRNENTQSSHVGGWGGHSGFRQAADLATSAADVAGSAVSDLNPGGWW